MRCLEKQPDDRYQTAKEVQEAWEKAWTGTAPSTPPPAMKRATVPTPIVPLRETDAPPPSTGNRTMVIGGVAVVLVLGAVGLFASGVLGGNPPPTTEAMAPPTSIALPPTTVAIEEPPPPPTTTLGIEAPADLHRTIASDPSGATVAVGGVEIGTTPVDLTLPHGTPTEITVHMSGRRALTRTILPTDPDTVTLTLERSGARPHPPQSGLPTLAPH